jgi:hypothetical protein
MFIVSNADRFEAMGNAWNDGCNAALFRLKNLIGSSAQGRFGLDQQMP